MSDAQRYRMNALSAYRRPNDADQLIVISRSPSQRLGWRLHATRMPWTNFSQFGAKRGPPRQRHQSGRLSNILGSRVAVGLLHCQRGKQFPPDGNAPDGFLIGSVAERSAAPIT